jgi:hypothetical protein
MSERARTGIMIDLFEDIDPALDVVDCGTIMTGKYLDM